MTYDNVYIQNVLRSYYYFKSARIEIQNLYKMYDMCKTTLYSWMTKYANHMKLLKENIRTNFIRPKKNKCNNIKITDDIKKCIIDTINKTPQILSKTICDIVSDKFKIKFTINHISRIIRNHNYTYKKVQKESINTTTEKFNLKRDVLITQIKDTPYDDIICVDEYHVCFIDGPNYGRSLKNTKCIVNDKPSNKRHTYSVIEAISNKGRVACTLINGSVNGDSFTNFILNSVLPHCTPKTKILMDNASIHRCNTLMVHLLINDITIDKIIYNVPYSPKYNPIEYNINTTKCAIKQQNIQNIKELCVFLEKKIIDDPVKFQNYYNKSFNHLLNDDKY